MIKSGLAEKLKSLSGKVLFDTRDEHDIDSFHAQYEVKYPPCNMYLNIILYYHKSDDNKTYCVL